MTSVRADFAARRGRAAAACRDRDVGALLLSPGSDLAYLAGYRIHTSERLTCLVVDADGAATLVVPELEAPRAREAAPDVELRTWAETDDPAALVAQLVPGEGKAAVSDDMWAAFVLRLGAAVDLRRLVPASLVTRGLRMRKDAGEIALLREVSAQADRAYAVMQTRELSGRTEREVGAELAQLLREQGHEEVTFTIVASGPNGASPHHATADRRIAEGDAVVLDFGGTREWYCSDITRTVHVGAAIEDEEQRVHDLVLRAQAAGYAAAREGATAASVDAAARAVISDGGYGDLFIHRTGHGIGLDGHEHPYLVAGNDERLEPGMAFSIEPGIYVPGRFGIRIEDIAIIGDTGVAEPLNNADRGFAIVA